MRYCVSGPESSRSHLVGQAECKHQSSSVIPHTHPPPLNSVSISREIFSSDAAMMACAFAVAQPAAALRPCGRQNLAGRLSRVQPPRFSGKARSRSVVAKFARDSSEPSTRSVVKYVKSSFDTPEDIFALAGIGFAGVAGLWASVNLIEVIDKLPVLPLLFELIGIVVAWLFIYNNLLFKPDREEFLKNIKSSAAQLLGQ